jgi:hypothetical protein
MSRPLSPEVDWRNLLEVALSPCQWFAHTSERQPGQSIRTVLARLPARRYRFLTARQHAVVISTSLHRDCVGALPRRSDAPRRPASPARVALAEWWQAFSSTAHRVWCLPELGGCEEELIDLRTPKERAIADR